VLHILIGAGFTSILMVYSFMDGVRFLRSNVDKVLYLVSCLLQKPILLPVLLPTRFRSRISQRHMETHAVHLTDKLLVQGKVKNIDKKVLPTNFLLAVQETNFLYSFALSGFVSFTTGATMLIENNFSGDGDGYLAKLMLIISLSYSLYGVVICIYMYGRKTDHLFTEEDDEDSEEEDEIEEEQQQTKASPSRSVKQSPKIKRSSAESSPHSSPKEAKENKMKKLAEAAKDPSEEEKE